MKRNNRPVVYLLLYVFAIVACKKESATTPPDTDLFVSATSTGSFPKATMQALASASGLSAYVNLIQYDVDFFKITYKTTYKGNTVNASGLLGIPKNVPNTPSLLSAQHGTMFRFSDAPSNFPGTFTGFELAASAGFITAIPDYLGFGVSTAIPHPYYDQKYSAQAVVDMIKAVKSYLAKQQVTISNRLFLLGYSEGGYVTMAAQKEIETNTQNNLTLTAVAAGAGGYDVGGMLAGITTATTYTDPSFLALIVKSYDSTYSWNRPYSDFFSATYAAKIPSLLDGSKSSDQINAALTTSMTALFNPTFYSNLQSPTGEPVLKAAVASNSLLNWAPKTPTRLFHGNADEAVFYPTSVSTYNNLKAAGATQLELITVPNGTHSTSVQPMMLNVLPWFQSLDKP